MAINRFDIGDWRLLLVAAVVSELLLGWIPYFVAVSHRAKHRHLIGICGLATAPTLVLFPAALLWALMGGSEEAMGKGFEVVVGQDGGDVHEQ